MHLLQLLKPVSSVLAASSFWFLLIRHNVTVESILTLITCQTHDGTDGIRSACTGKIVILPKTPMKLVTLFVMKWGLPTSTTWPPHTPKLAVQQY